MTDHGWRLAEALISMTRRDAAVARDWVNMGDSLPERMREEMAGMANDLDSRAYRMEAILADALA